MKRGRKLTSAQRQQLLTCYLEQGYDAAKPPAESLWRTREISSATGAQKRSHQQLSAQGPGRRPQGKIGRSALAMGYREGPGGGMKNAPIDRAVVVAPAATLSVRLKRLPRRHRIAHLRALIRRQPFYSIRREELAALLDDEMTESRGKENHAV